MAGLKSGCVYVHVSRISSALLKRAALLKRDDFVRLAALSDSIKWEVDSVHQFVATPPRNRSCESAAPSMTVALDLSGVARGNRPAGSIIDLDRLQRFPNYHHLPRSLPFSLTLLWDLPDVMSASEGGGRSWKSRDIKRGSVNFIV